MPTKIKLDLNDLKVDSFVTNSTITGGAIVSSKVDSKAICSGRTCTLPCGYTASTCDDDDIIVGSEHC